MIINLDVDGVLRPFVERCAEVFIKYHPQFAGEDLRLAKESRDVFLGYPVDKKYVRDFIFVTKAQEVFLDSAPYPNAAEEFTYLQDYCNNNSHSLMIISSQPNYLLKQLTLSWLETNGFLTTDILFIGYTKKYLFSGDVLIDDEVGNLSPWRDSGRLAICYSRYWNESWPGVSVKSLFDVIPIINNIQKL